MNILRKLFSISRQQNRININFLGIKISIQYRKRQEHDRVEELCEYLKSTNLEDREKELFLVNISKYIYNQKDQYALKLLKEYTDIFGTEFISNNLNVANFANNHGFSNKEFQKSSLIYNQIKNNISSENFSNYFKNKTIAIVGNSGCELNKKRGAEIDSHDIVIRFNNYPSDFIDDYGKKCTIWCRGYSNEGEILDRDISDFDYVIFPTNLLISFNRPWVSSWIYEKINQHPEKIACIPPGFQMEARSKLNFKAPTSGCMMILYILEQTNIENIDVYGFAFLNENSNDYGHYFDNKGQLTRHTNFDDEQKYLRQLFKKKLQLKN